MSRKAKENMKVVKTLLKSEDINYDQKGETLFIPITNEDDGLFQTISINKNSIMFSTRRIVKVDQDKMGDVATKMMRLNSEIIHGAYLIDPMDGEVAFKSAIFNGKGKLKTADVRFHHLLGFAMMTRMDNRLEELEITPISSGRVDKTEPMYS